MFISYTAAPPANATAVLPPECLASSQNGRFQHVLANPQAFITYGRQGNDRLLQFYGFVEAGNPADTYVVCKLDSAIEVTARNRVCHNRAGQSWHSTAPPDTL